MVMEHVADTRTDDGNLLVAGRYRLLEALGRGGMGRVLRAHDQLLDREVALKLIYDEAVADSEIRRACAAEARVASRLAHPGIARVLDSGIDNGRCFVVTELVEGQTLASLLREGDALPPGRALDLAIEIADALAAVHALGIVHCDVKPGNVVVAEDGRAVLVDFGIARSATMTTGLTEEAMRGSAEYVAPEQVEGEHLDGRVDIYALGVVLYEMIVGKTPFGGGTVVSVVARRLVVDPPSISEQVPTIPADLDLIARRALARVPDQRFQTAAEFRDALHAVRSTLAGTSTVVIPRATRLWAAHPRRVPPRAWWAAVVVPVLLLGTVLLSARGSQVRGSAVVEAAPVYGPAVEAQVTVEPTAIPATATSMLATATPVPPTPTMAPPTATSVPPTLAPPTPEPETVPPPSGVAAPAVPAPAEVVAPAIQGAPARPPAEQQQPAAPASHQQAPKPQPAPKPESHGPPGNNGHGNGGGNGHGRGH
jgi:predicted Ser/Thr protein kinase